jgi:tape measure domain-containing protein
MSVRAIEAARAFIRIYADDKQLKATLAGLKGQLQKTSEAFSGMGTNLTIAGLGAAATGMVSVAANAERTGVAFEVLLGSASAAKTMLDQIYALGKESPFGAADFMQAGQVLLNFGATADSVLPTMRMLGDIAAGDSEKLQRMTVVYGQMSAAGRLMGQDLLQMVNAGFNPLQQISQRTGESMMELKKRMEAGGISSAEVAQAFKDATSEGGRFFNMTARMSKTTMGAWMRLKDEIVMLGIEMGKTLLPAVNVAVNMFSSLVSLFGSLGKDVVYAGVALLTFLGVMKALTLAQIAYTKAVAIAQAFSGPKGWIMLAAGAAAAAVAVGAVAYATEGIAEQTAAAHPPLDTMAKDIATLNNVVPVAVTNMEDFSGAADDVNRKVADMRSPLQKIIGDIAEFQKVLEKANGSPKLLEGFREQQSGYADMLRSLTDQIRVLRGETSETELGFEQMLNAGVDPGKVAALRDLLAQKDQLQRDEEKRAETANKIMQAQADAQRAKEQKAAQFEQALNQSLSGRNQDLRSVSGAAQITSLVNGTMDAQKQALITAQDTLAETKRLRILAEAESKKGRKV